MRKRFVIAAFCIFVLPLAFPPTPSEKPSQAPAFSIVAFAGHTTVGGKCDCSEAGCICGPGEQFANSAVVSSSSDGVNQGAAPGLDPASGILTLVLVALLWFRMR